MPAKFPLPWDVLVHLSIAGLRDQRRSFRADSIRSVARLKPPLRVIGRENIPFSGPFLVVVNHYSRPGLPAGWLAMTISAVLSMNVHWVMTSAWTYPDRLRSRTLTPLSRWMFARLARVYGFILMPPMPPKPSETLDRAIAVRRILRYARDAENPVIGIALEGGDFAPVGKVVAPPPGAGRLVLILCEMGLPVLPVGASEEDDCLRLNFGSASFLTTQENLTADERDDYARLALIRRVTEVLESRHEDRKPV
jgi:1-acyl-sn-glycerol-3-phosphate acyltransferase